MRLPSKSATFAILMAAAAVSAFLLPANWTRPGRGLFGPLALLQWPAKWVAQRGAQVSGSLGAPRVSAAEARTLREENERLQLQVVQQQLALQQVRARLDEATRIASRLPEIHTGMIIAPVVAFDASPRRATLLVTLSEQEFEVLRRGSGQWVVAGEEAALDDEGRRTINRGWLIGRVTEVQPRLARVQLATDPRFRPVEVRPARVLADGTVQLAEEGFPLEGQGGGRMVIAQATEDFYASGYRLVVVPASRELPVPMLLGRISGSRPRRDSPQHYDLTVVPFSPLERLTHVYIIVPGY